MKTKKYQLKNGLTVLLHPNHKSPVISTQMWVRTGSADEVKGVEGISHFIEHLVFKGTKNYKVGEIASLVEGSGGELNAYTSFDQTVFYVTISNEYSDVSLSVISDMMGFPQFDPTEIDNEREVVIEEIKRGQDSLSRKASQLMFSEVFKKHPYGLPVIGYDKIIRKVSPKKIREYFQSRYVPRNMFLLVTGDFETKEMQKKVENYFGGFQDFKLKKIVRKREPAQKKSRLKVENSEFQQSVGYWTWRAPKVTHADVPGLSLLAFILGQGDSSRLVQKLRLDKPIANSCGSFSYNLQDDGLFAISFGIQKENLKECLDGILSELETLLSNHVSNEELQKAINVVASEQYYSMESVDGLANGIGSWEFSLRDPEYQNQYLKQVEAVTPEQLLKLARKYLRPENLTVTYITDADKKTSTQELRAALKTYSKVYQSAKTKKEKAVKFKPVKFPKLGKAEGNKSKTEEYNIDGVRVLLRRQKETPGVSLKSAFLGGLRSEPESKIGTTELFSRVWTSATNKRSEKEISHMIDFMAAGLGAFGGRNTFGLNADFLSPFTQPMMELFGEVLTDSSMHQEIIDRERQILVNQIRSRKDQPAQICSQQFAKLIFNGHPYSWELTGTEQSLAILQRSDLLEYGKRLAVRENMLITAVGDFENDKFLKELERSLKGLPHGKKFDKTFPIPNSKKGELAFTEVKKEQSHLIVGFPGLSLKDPRRHALQVMVSVLAGMGGRLFQELREKNSLAYSVAPTRLDGIEGGYFGAYIGCSPEKVEKAHDMMMTEFKKLQSELIPNDELDRAKRSIIGKHDIDLQRKSSVCSGILFEEIYGLDSNEALNVAKIYNQVTAKQIMELAKEIFSGPKFVSLAGPDTGAHKKLL